MSTDQGLGLLDCVERWNRWCIEEAHRHAGLSPDRPPIDPLAALAANQRAGDLLKQQRWWAVATALAAGSSWAEIADVLGTSPERARFEYEGHLVETPLEALAS